MFAFQKSDLRVGQTVRAFVPGTVGVIRTARIVSLGRKYAHLDFGLLGSDVRVAFRDITELS